MPKQILGAASLLALLVLPETVAAQPVDLLPGIYRLEGTDPDLPQADLEPLRQIVGSASVVALGEAIHTSGGYYELKHRVFRFLVEKMGFRVFAIESSWIDAERVSQYVRTCSGTPEEAIRGLFTVWQSTEVRDLVRWMCDWNRSHRKPKDKIHFFGFDVQQPERDRPALLAFLRRIGVGPEDSRSVDVAACQGVAKLIPDPIPEAAYRQCLAGLEAVERLFRADERNLIRRTSRTDLTLARMSLVGLRSWQGYAYHLGLDDYPRGDESRDSGMAYVFQTLRKLRHPKVKTVIWAHNFHIGRRLEESSLQTKTMGSFLREAFGSSYAAVAVTAHETAIDWPGIGCGTFPGARPENAVEVRLQKLGHETLLVDLDFPGGDPPFLEAGASYRMSGYGMVPADQFDGALYLAYSRKMSPLAWPSCQ